MDNCETVTDVNGVLETKMEVIRKYEMMGGGMRGIQIIAGIGKGNK